MARNRRAARCTGLFLLQCSSSVRVLNGIFWVLRSGAPWRDLPVCYGPRTTCKLMAKPRRTCPEFQRSSCLSGPEKELNAQLDQWAITIRYEDENPDDETQPAVAAPRPPDSCVKSEFRWCDWSADRVRFDSRDYCPVSRSPVTRKACCLKSRVSRSSSSCH